MAVVVNGKVATHSYFGLQMVPPYSGVTIENDYGRANLLGPTDPAHEFVYVGPANVIQNSAYPQTAEVPVTASAHADTITCTVNTADDTAVAADGDYTAIVNGTVTLASGVTATTVPVPIPPGTSIQPNRQFTVTLSACTPSNDIAEDPTGVVTINGAAPPSAPTVTAAPASRSVTAGQPVTFAAAADGSPTPAVQWLSEAPGDDLFFGGGRGDLDHLHLLTHPGPERDEAGGRLHQRPGLGDHRAGHPHRDPGHRPGPVHARPRLRVGTRGDHRVPHLHGHQHQRLGADHHRLGPARAGQGFTASTSLPAGTVLAGGASVTETVAFTPTNRLPCPTSGRSPPTTAWGPT